MKKIILALVIPLIALAACRKEGALQPSGLDRDWYALEDSSDPVEHLRYEIYASTGVPVFSNDTLGMIDRGTDALGQPWIYYETLKVDYWLTSAVTAEELTTSYTLSHSPDAIRKGLELFRDRIFPRLPVKLYPKSFLMTGRLYRYGTGELKTEWWALRCMTTTVMGKLDQILEMNDAQLDYLAAKVIAVLYAPYVLANFDEELQEFYDKGYFYSTNGSNYLDIYGRLISQTNLASNLGYAFYTSYGLLDYEHSESADFDEESGEAKYRAATITQDVTDFLAEVICYGDSDGFAEKWQGDDYELLREKYDIMLRIFNLAEASFQ